MTQKIQSSPIWKAAMTILICACALGGRSTSTKPQAEAEEEEAIARTEFTGRIENFFEYEPLKAGVFDDVLATNLFSAGVTEGDTTRRLMAVKISSNYFSVFGVQPAMGRSFTAQEETWRRSGAGSPSFLSIIFQKATR
jgi:hypothetical protein